MTGWSGSQSNRLVCLSMLEPYGDWNILTGSSGAVQPIRLIGLFSTGWSVGICSMWYAKLHIDMYQPGSEHLCCMRVALVDHI